MLAAFVSSRLKNDSGCGPDRPNALVIGPFDHTQLEIESAHFFKGAGLNLTHAFAADAESLAYFGERV